MPYRLHLKMKSERKFDELVEAWKKHCMKPDVLTDSSTKAVTECPEYREIVSKSYLALPLIRGLYDTDDTYDFSLRIVKSHGLARAVKEILKEDFFIPKDIAGKIYEMEEYTKKWLDENISKYKSKMI